MSNAYRHEVFRVLVSGYINVNVVDGSAFFLAGVSSMLAGASKVEVTLLTANPIRKTEVVDEVLYHDNVFILDPYSTKNRGLFSNPPSGEGMSRRDYARMIGEIGGKHDAILLRDTETAYYLVNQFPELSSKLSVYVTGITTVDQVVDGNLLHQLEVLDKSGVKFLCQTEAILRKVSDVVPNSSAERLAILPPHVPDPEGGFEDLYHFCQEPNRFVYTGKFFKAWNTDLILASFKAAASCGSTLALDIAGDQFRKSEEDSYFIANNRWLLDSTPGVTWHGRVPRLVSRSLISAAHIGIGWRSESMNNSSELSTKILEYGALARPSIVNRTELHEQLLGKDYPLFANSISEFKDLLEKLPQRPELVEDAARRCYELAVQHSYTAIRGQLLEVIGNRAPKEYMSTSFVLGAPDAEQGSLPRFGQVYVKGGVGWVIPDASSANSVEDQITILIRDELEARKFPSLLRKRAAEVEIKQSQIVCDSPSHTGTALSSAPNKSIRVKNDGRDDNDGKPVSAISKVNQLSRENETLQAKLAESEKRLNALRESKLGRLQVQVWKNRRGLYNLPKSNLKKGRSFINSFGQRFRFKGQSGD